MTPHTAVHAVAVDSPLPALLERFIESGYSRLPVYEGTRDAIIGVLHVKELLPAVAAGTPLVLRELLRPARYIVDSAHVSHLLTELRGSGQHMAFVMDEYGQTAGLVTLEDLLEEVVGEIQDEHDQAAEPPFLQREDGSWLVDAAESYDKVKERLGLPALADESEYATLAGMVLARLNRMAQTGDSVMLAGFVTEIIDMDGRRIDKVLIRPLQPDGEGQAPHSATSGEGGELRF